MGAGRDASSIAEHLTDPPRARDGRPPFYAADGTLDRMDERSFELAWFTVQASLPAEGHLQLRRLYAAWDVDHDLGAPCGRHGVVAGIDAVEPNRRGLRSGGQHRANRLGGAEIVRGNRRGQH